MDRSFMPLSVRYLLRHPGTDGGVSASIGNDRQDTYPSSVGILYLTQSGVGIPLPSLWHIPLPPYARIHGLTRQTDGLAKRQIPRQDAHKSSATRLPPVSSGNSHPKRDPHSVRFFFYVVPCPPACACLVFVEVG
jgi:hypothetical protein